MNIKSIIVIVVIIVAIVLASLYFVFVFPRQSEDVVQQDGVNSQGNDNQASINEKREEIKSRISYPNSNNDTSVNISYDFKQIPNDYSQNSLMDSLEEDLNSF